MDTIPYLEKIQSPALIIHGENDILVPFTHSERLLNFLNCSKRLEKIPKVCYAFKNKDFTTDYNFEDQQKAIELTRKWFEKWLKKNS